MQGIGRALFVPLALSAALFFACGGQKLTPAAKADTTTAACCDTAALAKCCPNSAGADCGDCATPVATDTATSESAPSQCVT